MGNFQIVGIALALILLMGIGVYWSIGSQNSSSSNKINYTCPNDQYANSQINTTISCSQVNYNQIAGNVQANYSQIQGFPSGCSAGNAIVTIGVAVSCSPFIHNSTFWFANTGNLVVKNNYYGLSGAMSSNEIPVSVFCPYAGYFKNLAFQITASSGTGSSIIITLDKNTVATSLVATCANPATTCVDNTHSVFCAGGANNYVDFQLTETGVPTAGLYIGISVNYVGNGV